jgi:hypothetical protein
MNMLLNLLKLSIDHSNYLKNSDDLLIVISQISKN